ncbi:FAD-dependent monooxygenase [Streptomyces sp. NRRL F-5123]|uniref:FAD-dependent monooxygenase n=1 Tax=Streptomyces sp. NRRL F-5123 TaxID=1463856 RepID=UPI00099C3195|nr:FAD-dependent monooxygenase [Streptomyces sp. NRRL F-5123]
MAADGAADGAADSTAADGAPADGTAATAPADAAAECDHAVVVGAGLSGLLTAHALTRGFARVTLVERDGLATGEAAFRAGVPQSRHVHILWNRGLTELDALLPGVVDELAAAGGEIVHAPEQMRWLSPAAWFTGVRGARYLSVSREVLEAVLRRRVLAAGAVTVLDRHEATGLVVGPDLRTVSAVTVRERGNGGGQFALPAELVVVATGRSSRVAEWLGQLGCPPPRTERIDAHLGYSSRYYRRPATPASPEAAGGWKAMYVQGNQDLPRSGVIVPIDGDRWLVTLIGQGGHQPPVEEQAWLDFAASLRSTELAEALTHAEPLSDAVAFRATANEWTHYESSPDLPARFLVVGDALCRFNPVYGHGMSVAALQARVVAEYLTGTTGADFAARTREVQKTLARCVRGAWAIATGEDSRYPETDGPAPGPLARFQQGYMARVLAAANTDPLVASAFFGVLSLDRRPESLLAPRVAVRARRRPAPSPQDVP